MAKIVAMTELRKCTDQELSQGLQEIRERLDVPSLPVIRYRALTLLETLTIDEMGRRAASEFKALYSS